MFALFIYSSHPPVQDDGIILEGTWRMFLGDQLYIDFWQFIPPGAFFLLYGVWKIFGISYAAARILSIITLFLGALGIYKINERFNHSLLNFIAPLIYILLPVVPKLSANNFNLTLIIWSIYLIIYAIQKKREDYLMLAGFLSGLSLLFIHVRSGVFFIITGLWLLWQVKKYKIFNYTTILKFFIVAGLISIPVFLMWPLNLMYESLIIWPSKYYLLINNDVPFWYIYKLMPAIAVLTWIVIKQKNKFLYYLLFVQAALLLYAIKRADFSNISMAIFPALILSSIIFTDKKIILYKKIALLLTFGIIIFWLSIISAAFFTKEINKPLTLYNEKIYKPIKDICGNSEYMYAGPGFPQIYFETRLKNAGPYYWLFSEVPDAVSEQLQAIKNKNVNCAVLVNRHESLEKDEVTKYIETNFVLIKSYLAINIYKLATSTLPIDSK